MNMEAIYYPETRFGGFSKVDGTVAFFSRVNALLDPSFNVLDVGCGRGAYGEDPVKFRRDLRILRGKVAAVTGLDVDPAGADNPYLDAFHLIRDDAWPIETGSIDLVVCDNVLEHLSRPELLFSESRRVLKEGGHLAVRTTNRLGYAAIVAQLIPNKYHSGVIGLVEDCRKEEDVFPTRYRCNTIWAIRRAMKKFDFEHVVYGYDAEPVFLSFSRIAYGLGLAYHRITPGFLKHALFAFGRVSKE